LNSPDLEVEFSHQKESPLISKQFVPVRFISKKNLFVSYKQPHFSSMGSKIFNHGNPPHATKNHYSWLVFSFGDKVLAIC
jgi:hypothetical protein